MDESRIKIFKSMFDLAKQDPLEVNILPKLNDNIQILEFTINIPHKKLLSLSEDKQEQLYLKVLENSLKDIPHENEIHYFEKSRDNTLHLHGKVDLVGKHYIEGVVQTFSKQALKTIDGRLRYDSYGYYPMFMRYRSPSVCAQYTTDLERKIYWDQYISKNN